MRLGIDVALVGRQAADQRAVQHLRPLIVIVDGLFELLEGRAHLLAWHVVKRHIVFPFAVRINTTHCRRPQVLCFDLPQAADSGD
jgi:hypothetical protein